MKNIFLAFLAAACLLGGCSKDNSNEEQGQGAISITGGGVINAGPSGVEQAITVTSSGDWRLSGVCDWVHPSARSGKSGDVVTFTVDPNPGDEAMETIFKFFTGAAVTPLKIISSASFIIELQSEPELNYKKDAQTLSVKLRTNVPELTVTLSDGGEEWIHFDNRSEAFGSTIMAFKVDENTAYVDRSSVVTISGADAAPVTITVNQKQTDIIIPENTSYPIGLESGAFAIKLQTNFEYIVEIPTNSAAWLRHQPAAPLATQSGVLTEHTENFAFDAATGLRRGKIIFKSLDGSYSLTINVDQRGTDHVYVTIPDANFVKYLEAEEYVVVVDGTKCELTMAGQQATSFSCASENIKSLEGIAAFTNLTSIDCNYNPLATIPLGDLAITSLDMEDNYYTATSVVVSGSKLANLNYNYCYSMISLDVSGCPALVELNFQDCSYLETLYLKTGQTIATINDKNTGDYSPTGTYEKVYK